MSDKFRILVLFGNVPLFGQELANINVIEAMRGKGAEVLFLIRKEWTRDTVQAELDRRGLPWVAVPYFDTIRHGHGLPVWLNNAFGIVGGTWQLLSWHWRFRPTHIHAANPESILNFLPALALLRTPLVYRAGDAPTLHHWLWRTVWRFTVRRASRIAPNSQYVERRLLASGVPKEKIRRVSNIGPPRSPAASDEAAVLPMARPDLCTFVYIGQLSRQKGVDLLIDAAIARCRASRNCRFLLAGDYSWKNALADELRSRVNALGFSDRIIFLGYVRAVRALLDVSDVLVCASVTDEPFGNVVVEAKQAGKPSVVFASGGLPELVEHGIDGYVCPEKSAAALETAFSEYERSRSLAREQGQAAMRSLRRLAGSKDFAEEWVEVFEAARAPTAKTAAAAVSRGCLSDKPTRILVLFGNVPLLGQELGNIDVLDAMHAVGVEVLFLIRREWTKETIQAELQRRGLAWAAVPYVDTIRHGHGLPIWVNNLFGVVGGSWQLLRWHRRFKPTHFHAANPENILNFLPALILLRTPLVYRAGDAPTLHHWLWRAVWRYTIHRARRVVAIGRFVETALLDSGVPAAKIVRVSNIGPPRSVPAHSDAQLLPVARPELCTFVFVGQLTRQKGVDLLVDAAIARSRVSANCRLLLAGDYSWKNPLAKELRSRVDELGLSDRIVFLGYVSAVGALLQLADVHVCPSTFGEAFGNVVIEAKHAGKASVIFPTGGLAELVEHGVDGYVCQEKTVMALEQALAFYESSPIVAREQGAAARDSLTRLAGNETFSAQWRAIYDAAA